MSTGISTTDDALGGSTIDAEVPFPNVCMVLSSVMDTSMAFMCVGTQLAELSAVMFSSQLADMLFLVVLVTT